MSSPYRESSRASDAGSKTAAVWDGGYCPAVDLQRPYAEIHGSLRTRTTVSLLPGEGASGHKPSGRRRGVRDRRGRFARRRGRSWYGSPVSARRQSGTSSAQGWLLGAAWQRSLELATDASRILATEGVRHGDPGRLMSWPEAVQFVMAGNVKRVAQEYLDPAGFTTVVAGPLAEIRAARHPRWPVALDELGGGAIGRGVSGRQPLLQKGEDQIPDREGDEWQDHREENPPD